MIGVIAVAVAALAACGVYLLSERTLFKATMGLALLAHAANLLVLSAGGWRSRAPILGQGIEPNQLADPLPQALVLTAIVISMAVTLYLLGIVARAGDRGIVQIERPDEDDTDRAPMAVAAELRGEPLPEESEP